MEHPGKEKLENYAARRLSAGEMTAVILHLEVCTDCFSAFQKLSPSVGNQSVAFFKESEVFHLDYDEHLRPFVDREADAATCEIVESHTQNCSNCAFQLRELREFAESLRLREIEKQTNHSPGVWAKMSEWFYQISRRRAFQIAFVFCLVSALGIAAFIRLRVENPPQKASRSNTGTNEVQTVQIQSNSNKDDKIIAGSANKNITNNFQDDQNPIDLTKTQTPENRKAAPVVEDKFTELKNLPENLRKTIQTALQSEKIIFPTFLSVIGGNLKLRGETNDKPITLSPNGEAIRHVSPRFSWENFASTDEKYIVELFDEQNNPVEISLPLTGTNWAPKTALERGRIYKWEVRTEKPDGSQKMFGGKFKVLEQKEVDELTNISAKSAFVRGVAFASRGLLTEAKKEFRQAVKENDRANLAQKFLRQIKKQR